MKVLIIDNNASNREMMNELMREQKIVIVEGLLEAPNRIMGSMLLEAIDFDLIIIGGGLSNILPDGSQDNGDGMSLIEQLLKKNPFSNVVLWTDKAQLQAQFHALLMEYKHEVPHFLCWKKQVSLQEVEENLLLIYPTPWQVINETLAEVDLLH